MTLRKPLSVALVLLAICSIVYSEVDHAQAAEDWVSMEVLLDEWKTYFFQSEFEKSPEEFVSKWQSFSERFGESFSEFTEKYGGDRQTLNQTFENVQKPLEAKRDHYALVNEVLGVEIENRRSAILDWADRAGRDNFRQWESMQEVAPEKAELKLQRAEKAVSFFKVASTLNPDGGYDDFVDKAQQAVKETAPLVKKALEGQTWPGHNPEYAGPGSPDAIAAAAIEFLKKNPEWSKPEYDDIHTPYAACVRGGDWEVYKRAPITQDPTQYSLDILVAFTGQKDSSIVYVYNMVFYTGEEGGIKKGLPLKYANSRQYAKYKMLKKAVKKSDGSGGSFGLWRILFSGLLIAGGLVGASTVVAGKVPQLKAGITVLNRLAFPLGILLAALGLIGFLGNLLRLAPLASLLPQLTAMALGIVFIRKSIVAQPAVPPPPPVEGAHAPQPTRTSKAADLLGKFAFLDALESPLGLAALALGVLHLLFGGFSLI